MHLAAVELDLTAGELDESAVLADRGSFIFGHEDYSYAETQLMIFVTPYLWEPGMETPILETG